MEKGPRDRGDWFLEAVLVNHYPFLEGQAQAV